MLTLGHLLPESPDGHATHRAITSRLHSLLEAHTSDERIADILLRGVLPLHPRHAAGAGVNVAAVQHIAGMRAIAQRLIRCVRSAYPAAEEIECFTAAPVVATGVNTKAGEGSSRQAGLSHGWLRMLNSVATESSAARHGNSGVDGSVLGQADARTAARDVLTRTLTRQRNAAAGSGNATSRARSRNPWDRIRPMALPAILEDGVNGAVEDDRGAGVAWGVEREARDAVRLAGSLQQLGLHEGRLGAADSARQQVAEGGPVAAMLPVLQAMLARCLSTEDLGLGLQQVCWLAEFCWLSCWLSFCALFVCRTVPCLCTCMLCCRMVFGSGVDW